MSDSIPGRIHAQMIRQSLEEARYEAGLRARVLDLLRELERDLVAELADAGLDTPRSDWQRARLANMLKATERRIAQVYGDVDALTMDELRQFVEVTGDRTIAGLNKALGVDLFQEVQWTTEQVQAIADDTLIFGARSGEWWARQSVDVQQAFGDQMRMGLLRGESVGQLIQRVRGVDGFMNISRSNAEKLVRSSAISVANEAHLAAFEANSDIMAGIEWLATLDMRTCPRCAALDRLRWTLDHEPIGHDRAFPGPVLHWNDRCTQLPVTKTWEELATKNKALARKLDQAWTEGERASMGGPVPGNVTYETWFKGLSAADQQDILGPGRYDLWKAGKVDLKGLSDQRGNELTLDQLRRGGR